jgi:hypothetical protein
VAASRSSRSATASAVSNFSDRRQGSVVPLEADQRAGLFAAKARGLVATHLQIDAGALIGAPLPFGAAVLHEDELWVLLGDDAARSVGPAMVWASRQSASGLHLLVDHDRDAGIVARRCAQFREAPQVWAVRGRTLSPAAPASPHVPIEPPATAREAAVLLHEAGLEVVIEHGEIRGEIRGLEVARVVIAESGEARVDVGVGRHDREAFAMVHGTVPTPEALTSVIASVDALRRPEAEPHPLRQLAPEGWLRWRLLTDPSLIGLTELTVAESSLTRESVKDSGAAIAFGRDRQGADVVVACSVGIDLDLVPSAADARLALDPGARLMLVLPTRDLHPAAQQLAGALVYPAQFVTIDGDWRVAGPERFS